MVEKWLLELDKIGLLPKNLTSLIKIKKIQKKLEKIREEPEESLKKIVGSYIPTRIYTDHEKEFYSIFATKSLPTFEVDEKYKQLIVPEKTHSIIFALFPFLYLFYKNKGVGGRTLEYRFDKSISNQKLPIIFSSKEDERSKKFKAVHENVHAIRSGWKRPFNVMKEEIYTYGYMKSSKKVETIIGAIHGGVYGICFGLNTPYFLFVLFSLQPINLLYPVIGCAGITALYTLNYLKKMERFIRRCEDENINPYYLMLRSNIEEFSLKMPIKEQIKKKSHENLRFLMINTRLEKDPPSMPKI